jgi:hypothetical protein
MVDAPVAALQMTRAAVTASDCGMALCGDWVYWARGATVYRGRVDGQGGDECLADARRENGTGPLDGGWSYAVSALMADPARERVLAFISEPNPIVPGEPGPREGVWAFSTNSGTWVCLVQMPIRGPDNWCYSGRIGDRYAWKDLWGTHTLDLATHQPDRLLGDSGPLLWRESVTATWKPLARRALADYGLPPGGDMATVGLPDARSPARLVLFQTEPGITPVIVFDGTQPRLSLPRPPALKDGLVTHVFPTVAGYVMAWTARDKPEHTRFSVWVPEPQPKN